MKICPVCESALFDDMETCFGCLYRFGSDPALEAARSAAAMPWPVSLEGERTVFVVPEQEDENGPAADRGAGGRRGGGGGGPANIGIATGGADGDEGGDGPDDGSGDAAVDGGHSSDSDAREISVPGWRLRVRSEGPLPRETALTIEIEPVF